MRLPKDHYAVHEYLKRFNKQDQLENFEQENKVIYLTGLGKTLFYDDFNTMLKEKDENLLKVSFRCVIESWASMLSHPSSDCLQIRQSQISLLLVG
jgi:hypothetical protein